MDRARLPVIVGVGQVTLRDQQWPDLLEPLDVACEAATLAATDAGVPVFDRVDRLVVPPILGWDYGNAPRLIADRLGLDCEQIQLKAGGNTPQEGINDAAEALAAGRIEMALVVGAECEAAKKAALRAGHEVEWARSDDILPGPEEHLSHPYELMRQALLPVHIYPLFEPALRVAAGRTPEEHVAWLGRTMSRFTEMASRNPHAWFREVRTPEELVVPTPQNRMISTPYTMRLNSFMAVDQGAAVLLTTAGTAVELGIQQDRWIWLWAGADCADVWYFTEHAAYDHVPAMRVCAREVLGGSGIGSDEVEHFDLYSCNVSVVQLAAEALGLAADDTRPWTVAGGLPYAGGPWNNYTTHAIAAMVETLRESDGSLGVVTGNGGFLTKHSFGLYGARPPDREFHRNDSSADTLAVREAAHPTLEENPAGRGRIEGYTVPYGRDGTPERVLALVRLDVSRRTLLNSWDPTSVAAFTSGEWFGREVEVAPDQTFVPV
ncbi:MAG: hypothetical protein IT198_02840 [Acidimicrobiia bacterium]|nr:hypothetical protein [Acidimicrobiia bacterium]